MSSSYEVKSHWGTLGMKKRKGEQNELQLRRVSWYGGAPVWDIREWTPDDKPGKGITMTDEMMKTFKSILDTIDFAE